MDSLNFRISSIYYLNIKFSLKIFHFLYLLAATWVLKTGFGIAIVFFFRSLKYDWGSNHLQNPFSLLMALLNKSKNWNSFAVNLKYAHYAHTLFTYSLLV